MARGPAQGRHRDVSSYGDPRFDSEVRPILRLHFLHEVAHMDLHRAFTHVQFVGDDFASTCLVEALE